MALDVANDVIYYLRVYVSLEERGLGKDAKEVERLRPIRGKFNDTLRFLNREFDFDRLIVVAPLLTRNRKLFQRIGGLDLADLKVDIRRPRL